MSIAARIRESVGLLQRPASMHPRPSFAARVAQYLEARRLHATFAAHHAQCQRGFSVEGPQSLPPLQAFLWLPLRPAVADANHGVILPGDYEALIDRIARDIQEKLAWTAHCRMHPHIERLPPRTADVPEIGRGEVMIQKLTDPLPIDGLNELCDAIVPSLEQQVFRSPVTVDSVQVSRTHTSPGRPEGSFLWHHDEFPREILKLLIYLNDVDETTAPFTYLEGPDGLPVVGSPLPMFGYSRISAERMETYLSAGCRVRQWLGPRGTCLLFSSTIVHRATFAQRGHRDALFLTLRPTRARRTPYVDVRWTATIRHFDFSPDPEDTLPPLL